MRPAPDQPLGLTNKTRPAHAVAGFLRDARNFLGTSSVLRPNCATDDGATDLLEDGTHADRHEQGGQFQFRAIIRDARDSIVSVRVFYTDTQVAAAIVAREMVDDRPVELWGEHGLIQRFEVPAT